MRIACRLLCILAVVAVVLAGATPAQAATEVDLLAIGDGSFSPPRTGITPPSSFIISATASGVVAAGNAVFTGALSCNFTGSATSASGGCHGAGLSGPAIMSCTFSALWLVAASEWQGMCSISVGGVLGTESATVAVAATWTVTPNDVLATSSFSTVGVLRTIPTGD